MIKNYNEDYAYTLYNMEYRPTSSLLPIAWLLVLFLSVGDKRIYKHNLILHYLQKQIHELNQ